MPDRRLIAAPGIRYSNRQTDTQVTDSVKKKTSCPQRSLVQG